MRRRFVICVFAVIVLAPLVRISASVSDCALRNYIELTPNAPTPNASFGLCVATDGDVAVVGAPGDTYEGVTSGAAYVYDRIDGEWSPAAKLTPSDATIGQGFGLCVAVEGNTIVVGSRLTIAGYTSRCAAYVFRRTDGMWEQVAHLSNSLGSGPEYNKMVVAVHGNSVAVGSPQSAMRGAVFLFTEVDGLWLSTVFSAPDTMHGNTAFGAGVALTDDQLLVGAPYGVRSDDLRSGLVYLYRKTGVGWSSIPQILSPGDVTSDMRFGSPIVVSDGRMVVGEMSYLTSGVSTSPIRRIYAYEASGASWSLRETLTAPEDINIRDFGRSIAVHGNQIALGSTTYGTPNVDSVFIYEDTGGYELIANMALDGDIYNVGFGDAIALGPHALLAGAVRTNYVSGYVGAAAVFDLGLLAFDCNGNGVRDACDIASGDSEDCNGNQIPDECDFASHVSSDCNGNGQPDECEPDGQTEIAAIESPSQTHNYFGWSVSMSGATAIVGAPYSDEFAPNGGAAYICRNGENGWEAIATLHASDIAENDLFGDAVGISGNTAVVGVSYDDDLGDLSGSVYVFREIDGLWQEIAKLTASDGAAGNRLGWKVAISGGTIVVGTYSARKAYVFREVDGQWQEVQILTSPSGDNAGAFGHNVAIDGDRIVVAQPSGSLAPGGQAYVLREIDDHWDLESTIIAPDAEPQSGDFFGRAVAISQETIAISVMPGFGLPFTPTGEPRVCVYRFDGNDWNQETTLSSDVESISDRFGGSLDLHADVLAVGDTREYVGAPTASHGPVHVFRHIDGEWRRTLKLQPSSQNEYTRFGGAVATDGLNVLSGMAITDLNEPQLPAVYVHDIRDLSYTGDLNDDGVVDSDDADILVEILLGIDVDPLHVSRADANCSGDVDGLDLQAFMARLLAG
ncbi:MAG TPA: hypothetical protein P5081_08510 [Phycisphaerae bacterium]|nr:hypothetical protein [Phycisphaerae bacterium]